MILGLRKVNGVDMDLFYKKYKVNIRDVFNIDNLIDEKKLVIKDNNILIPDNMLYLSNDILIEFID